VGPRNSGFAYEANSPVVRLHSTGQFLAADGARWRPPKALCGSSILPRESTYAAQAQMAGQVLCKDEMQGVNPLVRLQFAR